MKKLWFNILFAAFVFGAVMACSAQKPAVSKEKQEKIDKDKKDFENQNR
jgi:hypothetical protein